MMRNATTVNLAFSFLFTSLALLSACQRQDADSSAAKQFPVTTVTAPSKVTSQASMSTSVVGSPAIAALLNQVVRPDLPGMTFDQVTALFPTTCLANDDDRSITCPDMAGLNSASYGGGPDGIFNMTFSGGMASCKELKILLSAKFGAGEDAPDHETDDGACGAHWWTINPKNKAYHAHIRKLQGRDTVTLQIGAEQGP